MPVLLKHQKVKEELFFKDSILHASHLYTLGIRNGGIKRYPLEGSNPVAYAQYPSWLNALPSHETAQSISLDKDTLVMLVTGQPTENASAYQAIHAIDILAQTPAAKYAVDAIAVLHQIEVVELEQKKYLLATSNESASTFYVAPYPPPGTTIAFRTLVTMKENIVSWDYEAQTIAALVEDQTTHLLALSSNDDATLAIERLQSISPHPLYQFDNPRICYSSKKNDILLWEPQLEGSAWIFNALDSRYWYPLNRSIHHVVALSADNEQNLVDELSQDTAFYSLVRSNGQFEFHFLGTRFIEKDMFENWSPDDTSD